MWMNMANCVNLDNKSMYFGMEGMSQVQCTETSDKAYLIVMFWKIIMLSLLPFWKAIFLLLFV